MTRSTIALLVASLLLVGPALTRGDTVWIGGAGGGGGGGGVPINGVQIKALDGSQLTFLANGRETVRRQVSRVAADDEPALNAAEEAYAAGRFDVASDAYQKAMTSSTKEWVRTWAAQRLSVAGQRANRFDAAASGYVALLMRDPARAGEFKPAPANARSTFIQAAVAGVTAALATPNLSAASKQALETYRAELQGGATAPPSVNAPPQAVAAAVADANAAAASLQQARQKLDLAGAALDRKDFPAAINEIRGNAQLFTEGRDQAQALYFLAEAQAGLAAGGGAKNDIPAKNDVTSWQDAAIAYLRVVAHFPASAPAAGARPFAARSLLKAGKIQQEKLADPAAARRLYEQLTQEFPADPAAAEAKAILPRLPRLPGPSGPSGHGRLQG